MQEAIPVADIEEESGGPDFGDDGTSQAPPEVTADIVPCMLLDSLCTSCTASIIKPVPPIPGLTPLIHLQRGSAAPDTEANGAADCLAGGPKVAS
jgi:hypothetical protein